MIDQLHLMNDLQITFYAAMTAWIGRDRLTELANQSWMKDMLDQCRFSRTGYATDYGQAL